MMKPKLYFRNEKELLESAKEWKQKLFLSDWNIMVGFSDELTLNNYECGGISEVQFENSCGTITILSESGLKKLDGMEIEPQEKILIHELLHFIWHMYEKENQTVEQTFYNISTHQNIEKMAKSLYMAKYNLDYSWFRK